MEITAPSGKFCMAMPRERARAPAAVTAPSPESHPASTTPTAMPSGMLWTVTASTSRAVRPRGERGPSGPPPSWWRWGTSLSRASIPPMPSQNPAAAGKKAHRPSAAAWSRNCFSSSAPLTPGRPR